MTWKYRQGGDWNTATIKRRKGGQWVSISRDSRRESSGDASSRFYTDGPPERSGKTITYDGTNYSSLQAAHDNLNEGDTLIIDPSNDPYVERLEISTNHITIDGGGDLSFDDRGNVTVESQGAWVEGPDLDMSWAIGTADTSFTPDTSLAGSINGGGAQEDGESEDIGDIEISVTDASPFSVGDDIYILEEVRPYGEPKSGGASGPNNTFQIRTVEAVDTSNDTLTVDYPMFLPFPDNNSTEVGVINWGVEDICITGLSIRGYGSGDSRCLKTQGVRDGWFDNLYLERGLDEAIAQFRSYRTRYHNIYNAGHSDADYGTNFAGGERTYITNVTGENHNHYVVRVGGGGRDKTSTSDVLVDGITGRDFHHGSGPTANVHWGGFYVEFRNLRGEGPNARAFRPRSRHLTAENVTEVDVSGRTFVTRQRPFHVAVRDADVVNKDSGTVFALDVTDDKNERVEDLLFENIAIDAYDNRSITDIGMFNAEAVVDGLTFRNVTYDGQSLERSHVEQWSGYNSANVRNLTVE